MRDWAIWRVGDSANGRMGEGANGRVGDFCVCCFEAGSPTLKLR